MASAQQSEPKISPGQRDFTSGTGVVSSGYFQIESDFSYSRRGFDREVRLAETLVRVPIAKGAEVRAMLGPYLYQGNIALSSGLNDSNLAARVQLGKAKKVDFAITLGSALPTGSRRVAERRYQPQAILAASSQLSKRAELVLNAGIGRPTSDGERFTQSIAAAALRYDVTPKVNAFFEIYGFNRLEEGGDSQKFAAGGLVYLINRQTSLYGRVGSGLRNDLGGPDRYYGLGLARLF